MVRKEIDYLSSKGPMKQKWDLLPTLWI